MLDNSLNFLIRRMDGPLWDYQDLFSDMGIFPHLQMCIITHIIITDSFLHVPTAVHYFGIFSHVMNLNKTLKFILIQNVLLFLTAKLLATFGHFLGYCNRATQYIAKLSLSQY